MTRREFARGLTGSVVGAIARGVSASEARPTGAYVAPDRGSSMSAREVAGVRLIDSKFARAAMELCRDVSPPYLFNHAMRTFLFGSLIGKARRQTWDAEVLYLACVLHDLGLTSRFVGDMPFEIQGAEAAVQFLQKAGFAKGRSMMVWDGIAMHPYAIAAHKPPEVALVAAGAAADVVGAGLSFMAPHERAEVTRMYPRLQFKQSFVSTCVDVVRAHPQGASRGFMRDIGERYVAEFRPTNICDAIAESPFDE